MIEWTCLNCGYTTETDNYLDEYQECEQCGNLHDIKILDDGTIKVEEF